MDTYAAVVVTYNRLSFLKICIESLREQTVKLHSIIVINNNSTDGTAEWLNVQPDLTVIHQENGGGAAGFYRGIQVAYAHGFDWVWLMDDDVDPLKNCLEEMVLANLSSKNRYDVLQPDRKFFNSDSEWNYGSKFNFHNPFKPEAILPIRSSDFAKGEKIKPIVSFPFEGPMLSRKVIREVGMVDKRYFIMYDDTDYSARVYQAGFKVGFVKNAVMIKMINPVADGIALDWKLYYRVRNQIIIDRKFGSSYIAVSRAGFTNLMRLAAVLKLSIQRKSYRDLPKNISVISRGIIDGFKFDCKADVV
jgi:GT2 family glycosyltransferase